MPAIDRENFVTWFQAGLGRGRIRHHVTDRRGCFRFADRSSNRENDDRKQYRQAETEQRSRERDDDLVERGDRSELRTIHVRLALDDVHGRKLRQRDESAKRQRAERVLHAVDRFFPKRFAEPDAELLDVETTPARCQKMAQLMHNDEQIKKNKDLEEDEDDARDVDDHGENVNRDS